jgi:uncharacterized protein YxjI
MAVRVICVCGTTHDLKDEFAGKLVKCPKCGRDNRVPGAAVAAQPQSDPVFDRDVFLLRQQLLKISDKYDVGDEQGNTIVFVERPAHFLRNVGALLAGVVAFFVILLGVGALSVTVAATGSTLESLLVLLGLVGALVGAAVVAIGLSAKRHTTFYRDATKRDRLLEVRQDKKWQPITATYSVQDGHGRPLARLAKNYLYNIFRKRWYVYAINGSLAYTAKEDSIILSFLRRFLGPFFGLLRTNFLIFRGDSEDVVGEFKRKFTILDRYVLDMSADRARTMDRRLALALGVMLDTGERR